MHKASFLLMIFCLVACGSQGAAPASTSSGGGRTPIHIPQAASASAIGIVVLDMPLGWSDEVLRGLSFDDGEMKALADDVTGYLEKTTGLDVRHLHRLTVVVTPGLQVAIVVEDVSGTLTMPTSDDKLKAVLHGKTFIVGTAAGVSAAEAALAGKAERLADGKGALGPLIKDELAGAVILVAGDLTTIPVPELTALTGRFGARQVVASVGSRGIQVVVHGDEAKLASLGTMLEAQAAELVKTLEAQRQAFFDKASPERGPDPDALGFILGAHGARHFVKMLEPKVDKDTLRVSLALSGGSSAGPVVAVTVIGMLAAIAIPAFLKHIKKSKTAEAIQMVKMMSNGARSYYLEDRADPRTGAVIPHAFPSASAGPTPPLGECCKHPGETCPPAPELWKAEPWASLKFSVDEPSRYSYQFTVEGTGKGARYTASAFGDLDCDGVYSTFEMYGDVNVFGEPTTPGGMFMNQEIE
jgi:type II secretory pathway pseudopilin PulG